MTNILEVSSLSKHYDGFQLNDINFTIPKGYIMGLIGPNGSGKTTTIKCILNMVKKNSGSIQIFGFDHIEHEQAIKKEIGVVFDTNYFVAEWNMKQVEASLALFYDQWNSEKFRKMLERFRIEPSKKVQELSKGMQMKLMIACAFSYDAKLLILDEPTSGLDPVSRDELLNILAEYIEDGEHSVLFSTHITSDLDKIADYITFINFGECIFTGGKDEFIDLYRIVRGGKEELNEKYKKLLIGLREYSTGYEALIKTTDLAYYPNMMGEAATIDDIIIFINKGGIDHE